ncbi:MAG: tetratricopeptide repeat protein [Chloroflexi bacterium]|nr:tetratricopeptide repeat protein [Chloroflexota bacterium]
MHMPQGATGRNTDWPLVVIFSLVFISAASFGAYYYFDRYMHDNDPVLTRQTRHLEEMIARDPQNADLRVSAADFYVEIGMADQAIQQLNEALKIQPDHLDALILLGKAYTAKNDYRAALARYKRVVNLYEGNPIAKIDPRMSVVYYQMGELYNKQGETAQSVDALKHALAVDRTDSDAHYLLGTIYQKRGDNASAAAEYEQALRFVPDFADAYKALAQAYTAQGKAPEAAYAQAMTILVQGDASAAVAQLEALRKSSPELAQAQLGLGLAYDKLGRRDEARSALKAYLASNPDDVAASQALFRVSQGGNP